MIQKNKLLTLEPFNSYYLKSIWKDGFSSKDSE